MNKTIIILSILTFVVYTGHTFELKPLPKEVEAKVFDYLKPQLKVKNYDELGSDFPKVFKDIIVYSIWRESTYGPGKSSQGTGLYLIRSKKEDIIVEREQGVMDYLISSYKKKLNNSKSIEDLFSAFGKVEEVVKKDQTTYHIFNGKTFFDNRSGYVLSLKPNGVVESCKFEMKLSKK